MFARKILGTSSFRLALMYAALTGVSLVLLFSVILWSTTQFMRHQIDDSVSNELTEVLTDKLSTTQTGMAQLVRGMARHSSGFYYLLQDTGGTVLAGNIPRLDPVIGLREWGGSAERRATPFSAIRGRGVIADGSYLFVGWSTLQLQEMEKFVAASFLWGLAASIALALAGGIVMSRRLLRKIESVSETSRNIINGDLKQRVPLHHSGDEFDHLATSINAMLDRIEGLMEELRHVTTNIAHDLRTPLTRLRNRLEFSQRNALDEPGLRTVIADARRETDLILEVFGALLRIAQIESGARKAAFREVDLGDILDTVIELYAPVADERQQRVNRQIAPGLSIVGDRELLTQLFANLLENAVLHSGGGGVISIDACPTADGAEVIVSDSGPGIPEPVREKVFQRFFRMEGSRTTPGSGLGLSLVAAIAKLHDAALTLADNRPGLRVAVSFRRPMRPG